MQRVLRGADRLQREEERHTRRRKYEHAATAIALDLERGGDADDEVPNSKDPSDEQLNGRVRDADRVEHLVEVVGHQPVPGPLREPGDGDDDAHPLPVAFCLDERQVSNVLRCSSGIMSVRNKATKRD